LEKLIEYYRDKKLSHAYLISTNNTNKCMDVLLNVIKNIFCNEEYTSNCNKCSLCHLININSLPSLKIIEPDGSFIKKNQILELKNIFSKDSQYTKESIYIIKNCEKMNKESANSMLKFLEEPDGNVIGFFITNNKDNVMLTIQSRCQHIDVYFNNEMHELFNVEKEKYEQLIVIINDYLQRLEVEKKELILYNKKYLADLEKEDIKLVFQILLKIYKDELNSRYNIENTLIRYSFLERCSIKNVTKKINLIIEILKEMQYNVNLDLLIDRFAIEMEGINNETL